MMERYIATFHTHFSAMRTDKNLADHGIAAQMAPVPRSLSTSCGTCIRYEADSTHRELMHEDFEAIYAIDSENHYQLIAENE